MINQYERDGTASTALQAAAFANVGGLTILAWLKFQVWLDFVTVDTPVSRATYSMMLNHGDKKSAAAITAAGHQAPITVFTMNIVDAGYPSIDATFASGAVEIRHHTD